MVRSSNVRDDTEKLLRDLLELWSAGTRLEASVVLHVDGTGRFSVKIEGNLPPDPAEKEFEGESETSPGTPRAIKGA